MTRMPSLIYSGPTEGANSLTSATYSVVFLIGPKKKLWFRFHIAKKLGYCRSNKVYVGIKTHDSEVVLQVRHDS
jgi:hypothetical protein